ncbi:hypothetical protein LSAT2_010244, partial [Lamellibrachia satsuma]
GDLATEKALRLRVAIVFKSPAVTILRLSHSPKVDLRGDLSKLARSSGSSKKPVRASVDGAFIAHASTSSRRFMTDVPSYVVRRTFALTT